MERGNTLPVVRDVSFQFPVFLVYARKTVENLPGDVGF
ncbi:hypothetical protein BN128_88 [Cronobacter sakazakii 696]|nr:hypothetical protein BN128_88 [Cronobacter sakazakii 696]